MMRPSLIKTAAFLTLLAAIGAWPALAQDTSTAASTATNAPAASSAPDQLTLANIETQRKTAEQSALNDELKQKVLELYRQAADHLQQAEQLKEKSQRLKTVAERVESQVQEYRQRLEQLNRSEPSPPEGRALAELEQELSTKKLKLDELKKALTAREAEPATRAARRKEIRAALLATPQQLSELEKQFAAPPPADEEPLLSQARRTEQSARRVRLNEEAPALQHELARYDAEEAADLIRIHRDLLAREITVVQKELQLINDAVRKQRDEQAQEAVRRAQEEAVSAQPLLKPFAQENKRLAEKAQSLTERIAEAEADLQQVKQRLEAVDRQFTQTKKKVDTVGLNGAIGLMLRKQRTELPNVRRRAQRIRDRQQVINDAQLLLLEHDDQRSAMGSHEAIVRELVTASGWTMTRQERDRLGGIAKHVLDRKREYLDQLIRAFSSYFDTLVELDSKERELVRRTEEYQAYIDEFVLWIRSAKPLYADLRLDVSDQRLMRAATWTVLADHVSTDVRTNVTLYVVVSVLFLGVLYAGHHWRRALIACGEAAARGSCDQFVPTVRAVVLTVLLSAPWPALLFFFSWRLRGLVGGDVLALGLAQGTLAAAWVYLALQLVRQICRNKGLAQAHFGWPTSMLRDLRRNVRTVLLLGFPLVLFVVTLQGADPEHGQDVLERTGFLFGTIVLAAFFHRTVSPNRGVLREYVAYHTGGWIDRLKHVWHWAAVACPLALAVLSVLGYHYTALELAYRLLVTLSLVVLLIVVRALLLRLTLVARRKISIAEARRRRAEETGPQKNPAATVPFASQIAAGQADQHGDLKAHSEQTNRLVGTSMIAASLVGLWIVWSDVVPALGFLDRVELWPKAMASTASGLDAVAATEHITLVDVGVAALIGIVAFAAARNIPGLLEIALLRRLPLENSVRYAIATLVSYVIALVGVVAACNAIGLRWSQIQWLATALTFGLAFGLQEMFANFIAGLILLFEQPIRVGDIVTVDDTTGVVSRIRIRATTITNWDRKEFIVPNKEFITGKLLNWTLSDQTNRIVISVGIAYGSDTQRARELLLKVATDHPLICKEPPSVATFEGFGDSCLNFTLRTFLPAMENRLSVIHDLHATIDRAFRDAGIEIAFPQRDLHLRNVPDALVRSNPLHDPEPASKF